MTAWITWITVVACVLVAVTLALLVAVTHDRFIKVALAACVVLAILAAPFLALGIRHQAAIHDQAVRCRAAGGHWLTSTDDLEYGCYRVQRMTP